MLTPLLFHFQRRVYVVESWPRVFLNSGVTQDAVAGFTCKLWSWNTKSRCVMNSKFNGKLVDYSREVRIEIICAVVKRPGSSKVDKGGATKKRWKGSLGRFFGVFGNTLVLTGFRLWVHVEIHIRGLSVWSMSHGITTSGGGGQLADRARPLNGVEDKPSFLH